MRDSRGIQSGYVRQLALGVIAARWWWLGAVVLIAIQGPHLDQGDFRTDTGRYASIGLLAARSLLAGDAGAFWTLHAPPGEVYFNKPPLAIWIHGVVLAVFGVGLVAARIPVLLAAAGCCVLTSAIGREVASRRVGMLAGLSLALSYEFFRRVREISLDMWQLLFLLLAVWLVARGARLGCGRTVALSGSAVGLALMTKPLVGLIALALLLVWLVWIGRSRLALWLGPALGLALLVALPWHLSMGALHGGSFWEVYLGRQVVARAAGELGSDPWWYYGKILAGTSPWLVFAVLEILAIVRGSRASDRSTRGGRAWKLGVLWAGAWLVLISCFADKSPRYALPVHPGVALLSGLWLARAAPARFRLAGRAPLRLVPVAAPVVFAVLALAPIRVNRPVDPHWVGLFGFIERMGFDNGPVDEGPAAGGVVLYEGGMDYAKAGNIYLRFGWWPVRVADPGSLPVGSYLVYHTGEHRARPCAAEARVFEQHDLIVTRLEAGPWAPVMAQRIGKLERPGRDGSGWEDGQP